MSTPEKQTTADGHASALAVADGSASAILTDLIEDPSDTGDYRLRIEGDDLARLWRAIERIEKDSARLDLLEASMRRHIGAQSPERTVSCDVHMGKPIRVAIDETLRKPDRDEHEWTIGAMDRNHA